MTGSSHFGYSAFLTILSLFVTATVNQEPRKKIAAGQNFMSNAIHDGKRLPGGYVFGRESRSIYDRTYRPQQSARAQRPGSWDASSDGREVSSMARNGRTGMRRSPRRFGESLLRGRRRQSARDGAPE